MEQRKAKWRPFRPAVNVEKLLEGRYDQLVRWGILITRGDESAAREIVHDLCLHLILTKTDFKDVTNLDGYLYTSLRHVYLSRATLVSREALRFVSVADFDCIQFALYGPGRGESLTIQNELRAICGYSVWRKEASKSFSYFVLHFFHGYFPREIAEIAGLPTSAIYNKLKGARTELRAHFLEAKNTRSIKLIAPPEPRQSPFPVATSEFFQELRQTILRARNGACLSEEGLLAHYAGDSSSPIPCDLLSHIVSCERCLGLVDHHSRRPTLKDRDALDGFDRGLNMQSLAQDDAEELNVKAMFGVMRRRKERIYHHRPQTLFITVNARVVAFQDVQGAKSGLAVRLDRFEQPQFVEVFSNQHIRLAMIPIDGLPPDCPSKLVQRTFLSDRRSLELILSFDGHGLQGEVFYFDPDGFAGLEDGMESMLPSAPPRIAHAGQTSWISKPLATFLPWPLLTYGLALVLALCACGYFLHINRRTQLDAATVLNGAINAEALKMVGTTKHQTVNVIETTSGGLVLHGVVEVWQEGQSGRFLRRLYDTHDHVLASEWRDQGGTVRTFVELQSRGIDASARQLAADDLWKQDLSPRAFQTLAADSVRVSTTQSGYELSTTMDHVEGTQAVSAILALDGQLSVISEDFHLHKSAGAREVRLVKIKEDFVPSSRVPDDVFHPQGTEGGVAGDDEGVTTLRRPPKPATDTRLIQLEIASLYELNQMGADIGEPIEIARTSGGRLRIIGTMTDDKRESQLLSRLSALADQQLLTIQLSSQSRLKQSLSALPRSITPSTNVYSIGPAAPLAEAVLHSYFGGQGLTGDGEKAAVARFSQDALEHAQHALQHAYALNRLGKCFSAEELRSADPTHQQQWVRMVSGHALGLETQLRALQDQLVLIAPGDDRRSKGGGVKINDPSSFAHAAERLLQDVQQMNRTIGIAFASGVAQSPDQESQILKRTIEAIPSQETAEVVAFARDLSGGAAMDSSLGLLRRDGKQ